VRAPSVHRRQVGGGVFVGLATGEEHYACHRRRYVNKSTALALARLAGRNLLPLDEMTLGPQLAGIRELTPPGAEVGR
jgi:hypothetical protein